MLDPATGRCDPVDLAGGRASSGLSQRVGDLEVQYDAVPATLRQGFDSSLRITITNRGQAPRAATQLRVHGVRAGAGAVDRYLRAAADKTACTNTCNGHNGTCDTQPICREVWDAWRNRRGGTVCDPAACPDPTTDCADCRPRESAIEACSGQTCSENYFQCDLSTNTCSPELIALATVIVEDLAPNGAQTVDIPLRLPPDHHDLQGRNLEGAPLQLVLAINEQRLVETRSDAEAPHAPRFAGQPASRVPHRVYGLDPNFPPDPKKASLHAAEGTVKLGVTTVAPPGGYEIGLMGSELETREAGGVGGVRPSSHAFELDTSARLDHPAFHVRLRVKNRGAPASAVPGGIPVRFRLRLPGHTAAPGWEDEAAPEFRYDAERTFDLDVQGEVVGRPGLFSPVDARLPAAGLTGEGAEVDVDYVLRLSRLDTKLLAETLRQRALYPAGVISPFNEIAGRLIVEIEPSGEVDATGDAAANNRAELAVVFMAPEAGHDAQVTDPVDPVATYEAEGAEDLGPYEELDHLTPTLYDRMGGEWLGAAYQVLNQSSKERQHGAIVKQRVEADDFVKAWFLLQEYTFMALQGHADVGTQRAATANSAALSATLRNDKLVDVAFDPDEMCEETDDEGEVCTLFEINARDEEEEDPPLVELEEDPGTEPETTLAWMWEYEKEICYKKFICLIGHLEAEATVGVRGAIEFVHDARFGDTNPVKTSLRGGFGPFVNLTGKATGSLSITLARAALEGELTFLDADFIPTVELSVTQRKATDAEAAIYNDGEPCWMLNEGEVAFVGNARLESLSGKVDAAFYAGMNKCVFGLCFNFEFEVWRFALAAWDAVFSREWKLWDEATSISGNGTCATAPVPDHTWSSPKGCKTALGADAYCSNSGALLDGGDALRDPRRPEGQAPPLPPPDEPEVEEGWNTTPYGHRFYMGPSGCAQLVVDGDVQLGGDWLDVVGVYENTQHNRSPDAHLGVARQQDCRDTPIALRGDVDARREPLDRPLDCRWEAAHAGVPTRLRVAGQFDQQVLNVCDPLRRFGAVDLFLNTDGAGVERGVDVTIRRLDPPDDAVYSDETWRGTDGPGLAGWSVLGQSAETFAPPGVECCDSGPDFGVWTAEERRTRIKYLTSPGRNVGNQYEGRTVAFRRPFLPTADRYRVLLQCDDHCSLWIDGTGPGGLVAHTTLNQHAYVEIGAPYIKKGRMQMLGLHLQNDRGPGWVRVALKKVEE